MKKLGIILLATLVSLCFVGCIKQDQPQSNEDEQSLHFLVEGEKRVMLVKPIELEGELLISIDDASEIFGLEFKYVESSGTITASTEDYQVQLTLNSETAIGTRKTYTLDVPPCIENGTVMLPLDFLVEQLGYKMDFDENEKTVAIEALRLIRDVPEHEYQEWVIARARQLTEFKFVPLKDIPTITSGGKTVFKAGEEYKGFPYSSTEVNDKFLCENVSFETFLSALSNPDSVLYTKDMYHTNNASTYYGIVCNSFVRYCLGIRYRCNTRNWFEIPGMNQVKAKGRYSIYDLQLCDVLHRYGGHVAIITGILRDEDGAIRQIEVSEAVRTTCKRRLYSVEDFSRDWGRTYTLCRYEYLSSVPAFDEDDNRILQSGIEKTTPMIAVDYGDKSNYSYGDTTVISSFAEGEGCVQIYRNGALTEEISVNGYEKISRILEPGYYTVKLAGTDYKTEFCVYKVNISHSVEDGYITINALPDDPESKIIHMEFRGSGTTFAALSDMIALTEEEISTGTFVRKIPSDAYTYKVSFENKYGIYTHTIIQIYE